MNDLQKLGFSIQVSDDPTEQEIISSYSEKLWENKDKKKLNENEFANCFKEINRLQYSKGLFYTNKGIASEEIILKDIWLSICGLGINTNVEQTTKKLLGAVKLSSTVPELKPDKDIIPFANGDLNIKEKVFYLGRYNPSPYRLPVALPLTFPKTPNFKKWLGDLFRKEDLPTIRQYLGYCLLPSTKSQKALFLVGEGGAGKSVLGVILQAILGNAMVSTVNTKEFLADKFKIAELENKLVLYDDDLDNEALSSTGVYKKLITNTEPLTAERKYGQPFKFIPQIKLVACCNEMLTSETDQTSGFYRRLLPVVVKPIAPDFKPDLMFYDKIKAEAQGILGFALGGLMDLINSNWLINESEFTTEYLATKQSLDNPMPSFMESVFEFGEDYKISSQELKTVRNYWCRYNDVPYEKMKTFTKWLSDNCTKYNVKPSENIMIDGKRVRGYLGMKSKSEWQVNGS